MKPNYFTNRKAAGRAGRRVLARPDLEPSLRHHLTPQGPERFSPLEWAGSQDWGHVLPARITQDNACVSHASYSCLVCSEYVNVGRAPDDDGDSS